MKRPSNNSEHLAEIALHFEENPMPEPPEGAVYPLPNGGNYEYPENFRIPNFCDGCPLAEIYERPQISYATGMYPVGGRHIGQFSNYVADVLVLNEAGRPEISPVYLGELDIVSTFSVEHESPISKQLGRVHRDVDRCGGAETKSRFFREDQRICMSGLVRVSDFMTSNYTLDVNPADLNTDHKIVVPPNQFFADLVLPTTNKGYLL